MKLQLLKIKMYLHVWQQVLVYFFILFFYLKPWNSSWTLPVFKLYLLMCVYFSFFQTKLDNAKQTGSGGGKDAKLTDVDLKVLEILGRDTPTIDGTGVPESRRNVPVGLLDSRLIVPATPSVPRKSPRVHTPCTRLSPQTSETCLSPRSLTLRTRTPTISVITPRTTRTETRKTPKSTKNTRTEKRSKFSISRDGLIIIILFLWYNNNTSSFIIGPINMNGWDLGQQ